MRLSPNPFGRDDMSPVWEISFLPDDEEVQTWNQIFSIRDRLTKSVLSPSYDLVLGDLLDWLVIQEITYDSSNHDIVHSINSYVSYKTRNRSGGISFLNHKISMMIAHHFSSGNQTMIDYIRSGLATQRQGEAA
ncbi:hypothetical protein J7438_09685 [Thalassotalea sp. G20_0]|uniref:hypothetical protein n=1 Tax=Thalassotalea sp. G20_0 TaxID=2821093 RepID=UPI001ADC888D|nr:hypothetical protein [Thalassotalea sp. G20_0]MBO9494352.1 hypothetical protein [Thalassotalea sp. G20_0]